MSDQSWPPKTLDIGTTVVKPDTPLTFGPHGGGGYDDRPDEDSPQMIRHFRQNNQRILSIEIKSSKARQDEKNDYRKISAIRNLELELSALNVAPEQEITHLPLHTIIAQIATIRILIEKTQAHIQALNTASLKFSNSNPLQLSNSQLGIHAFKRLSKATDFEGARKYALNLFNESYRSALDAQLTAELVELLRARSSALATRQADLESNQHTEAEARRKIELETIEKQQAEEAITVANTFSASGAVATTRPLIFGYGGTVSLSEWASSALHAAIQRAVARLLSNPLLAAGVALVSYSPTLGNGELKGASIPLYYFTDLAAHDWQTISGSSGTLPVRLSIESHNNILTLYATSTAAGLPSPNVRVIPATWDAQKKRYSATLADTSRTTLTWTPNSAPGSGTQGSPGLPIEQPPLTVYTGDVLTPVEPQFETYPVIDDVGFDDYIVWFPQDSGLAPVYAMFMSPRYEPGIVTGYGGTVAGTWLGEGTRDRGVVIPAHIADKLRGQKFQNFDGMRNAFWALVGTEEALLMQFSPGNRGLIKRGLAPKTLEEDWVNGRTTFELHHVHEIQDGGDVYNIDNLLIVTPKAHVNYYGDRKP